MHDDIFIVPVVFGALAFVAWVIVSAIRRYKTAKLQAEVQNRVLDRLASSQDLTAFAQTDAGRQMLESLKVERSSAYGRIIATVQSSIVMLLLGGAMFYLRSRVFDAAEEFTVFGTLILTLGLGLGISSAVSYGLSKSFGLLDGAAR